MDEEPTLRKSLTAAAERPRRAFFQQAGDEDDRKYHALSDVIRAIAGDEAWYRDSKEAFKVALRRAIDKLDETFPIDGSTYSGAPKKKTALILYGYSDHEITPRSGRERAPYDYKGDYLPAARQLLGDFLGDRTQGRAFEQIRDDLADILIEMAEDALRRREISAQQSNTDALPIEYSPRFDYIPRLELYAELDAVIDDHHIIGLVGDGGTGKSTLAQRYVELHAPGGSYIFADFRGGNDLAASLHESFTRLGISTEGLTAEESWLKLRDVLATPAQWPKFVILDNVQNADQRKLLGVLPSEITFVITTRDDRVLPREAARIVVGDLSEEQTVLAIRRKLPDVTEDELRTLELLRGRVLAIDIACSFMREVTDEEDRTQFARVLQQYVAQTISSVAPNLEQPRPTLDALYVEILRHLESDRYTALAVRLLELEVAFKLLEEWAPLMHIQYSGHREYYFARDFVGSGEKTVFTEQSKLAYRESLKTLARYHIIRVAENSSSVPDTSRFANAAREFTQLVNPYRIDMHPLTVETLGGLFSDCLPERCDVLIGRYVVFMRKKIARYSELMALEDRSECPEDLRSVWFELGAARNALEDLGMNGMRIAPSEFFRTVLDYAESVGELADNLAAAYGLTFDEEDGSDS